MKTKVLFYNDSFSSPDCCCFVNDKINEIKSIVDEYSNFSKKKDFNDPERVTDEIISIITSKEFNYQSKIKINNQICRAKEIIYNKIKQKLPIDFYLDLGGGYHASIGYEKIDKKTDVNFSEVIVLYQIAKFISKISRVYSGGVRMNIIIDNLVAFYVNDIELERTELYCKNFRKLIRVLKMEENVKVFLESENPKIMDKLCCLKYDQNENITEEQYENIIRFQDIEISPLQAKEKFNKYKTYVSESDKEINSIIGNQIRFVQRSDNNELTFRSFPGGASRIQCGQIAVIYNNEKNKFQTELFTSRKLKTISSKYLSVIEIDIS